MSRRRLSPDELELWQRVARTTDRLQPGQKNTPLDLSNEKSGSKAPSKPEKKPLSLFQVGEKRQKNGVHHDVLPGLPEQLAQAPVKMDQKAFDRMKRGKLSPEARIDLHGKTLAEARPALTAFVMSSHAKDRRLILVITGKGKSVKDDGPIPERPGVLRHAVPDWLRVSPLAQIVLQVTPAHAKHGGGGAYYVYLRRRR